MPPGSIVRRRFASVVFPEQDAPLLIVHKGDSCVEKIIENGMGRTQWMQFRLQVSSCSGTDSTPDANIIRTMCFFRTGSSESKWSMPWGSTCGGP